MDLHSKQIKESEIDHFNNYGESLDFDAFDERGYKRIISELLKNVSAPYSNLKTIDLGCATGCFTIRLSDLGFKIKGIDISPNCIKFAQKKYGNIEFKLGDIEKLDLPDEEFDVVFLFGVLHHFPKLTDSINECYRILKKGGILFTYDPHMHNPFTWLYRNKRSPFYSAKNVTENERPLVKAEVRKALEHFKFANIQVSCISGATLNPRSTKFARIVILLMGFYNLSEILMDFYPVNNLLGSSLISVSRK